MHIIIIFLLNIYFIFVVEPPSSLISLACLTQLAIIQPKNLSKNNKNIHNGDCILAKNYFTTKKKKKPCVIGETKVKFFATTIN